MATYKEQVESYIGPFSDNDALSQFLTQGAKRIVDLLPPEKLVPLGTLITVPVGGAEVANSRLISVSGEGFPARYVSNTDYGQFLDPDSLFYAVPRDPVYFITNGSIFVRPSSTADTMFSVPYPEVVFTDDNLLLGTKEYDELVVLYAAIQCRNKQFETARGLIPTPPAAPDFSSDLAAIQTKLVDEEDIELAIAGYGQSIAATLSIYMAELQKFQTEMQAAIHNMTIYQASLNGLQAQYNAALQMKFGLGVK